MPGVTSGQKVWITMQDGRSWTGLLADMSGTSVKVTRGAEITTLTLADVRRIEAPDRIR